MGHGFSAVYGTMFETLQHDFILIGLFPVLSKIFQIVVLSVMKESHPLFKMTAAGFHEMFWVTFIQFLAPYLNSIEQAIVLIQLMVNVIFFALPVGYMTLVFGLGPWYEASEGVPKDKQSGKMSSPEVAGVLLLIQLIASLLLLARQVWMLRRVCLSLAAEMKKKKEVKLAAEEEAARQAQIRKLAGMHEDEESESSLSVTESEDSGSDIDFGPPLPRNKGRLDTTRGLPEFSASSDEESEEESESEEEEEESESEEGSDDAMPDIPDSSEEGEEEAEEEEDMPDLSDSEEDEPAPAPAAKSPSPAAVPSAQAELKVADMPALPESDGDATDSDEDQVGGLPAEELPELSDSDDEPEISSDDEELPELSGSDTE